MSNTLFKKVTATAAALSIVLSIVAPVVGVQAADDSTDAANRLAALGVIVDNSTDPSKYNLGSNITRREMLKVMMNLSSVEVGDTCEWKFSDLPKSDWGCKYAEAALNAGFIAANTKFRPNDMVTEAEALKMVMQARGIAKKEGVADWAQAYAAAAVEAGILAEGTTVSTKAAKRSFTIVTADSAVTSTTGESATGTDSTDDLGWLFWDLFGDSTGTDMTGSTVSSGTTTTVSSGTTTVTAGDLEVSLNPTATIPAGTTLPVAAGITVGAIDLTAGNSDVSVTSVKLYSKWVWARTDLAWVSLFVNSAKVAKSKTVSSEDVVDLNMISPLVVKAGSTVTVNIVVSTASAAWEHYFEIAKDSIVSSAANITGALPVATPLFKTSTTSAGTLTFAADWSLADVKLGALAATLQKFKISTDGVEDITVKSMTFKKDSTSTAQDSDVTNLKLFMNGSEVASGNLENKYVTFTLNKLIEKNKSDVKFEVRWDVVGGASKTLKLVIDSTTDVSAAGSKYAYGANVATITAVANSINITAWAVTLIKEDAVSDKVMKNKKDVVLGKIKVTANSGKDVELSTLKFTIDTTLDSAVWAASAFGEIENLEVYNENTNQVYDLTYVSGNASKIYSNTDLGLILKSGTTYTLVVRADTKTTAVDGDYTVKIASATGGDVVMKEVSNDTTITDITPNAVSLKKVSVQTSGFTTTQNALSTALNAVIGSSDVELINFNIKANDTSDLKIKELKFADEAASTMDNTLVSGFKLYQITSSGTTLVKEVGTSDLASQEVTVRDLAIAVPANTTAKFKLLTSLVKDTGNANKTIKVRLSGYSVEDKDGTSAYDTSVDANSDGVITAATAWALSARTVTVQSTGTATLAIDTQDTAVSKDKNIVAGKTSDFVAAYKISAANEGVKVRDLTVTFDSDVSSSVDSIILYKGDKVTEIARETATAAAVSFTNIPSYVVSEGTESMYVKLVTRKIGKNEAWVIATGKYLTSLSITKAEGASSGDTVTIAAETTDSKLFSIIPVSVSNVTFVSSAGWENVVSTNALSSAVSQIVGIVAVTTDSWDNTNSAWSKLKAKLTNLEYELTGWATAYAGIKITKIGGSDTDGQAAAVATSATSYFDMSSLTSGDNLVEAGQTAYYKIEVTPTIAAGQSLNIKLPSLDDAGANKGIDYDSDAGSHTVNKLNIGMTTVTGPTLSRPN